MLAVDKMMHELGVSELRRLGKVLALLGTRAH